MDEQMLRHQALNVATMRAKPGASTAEVLADAETVFAWLSKGEKPAPVAASKHESEAVIEAEQAEQAGMRG